MAIWSNGRVILTSLLEHRRTEAINRLGTLQSRLTKAQELARGKACVYITGSFGRGEASDHSDLDLFIVGKASNEGRLLSNLDEILIKGELIAATRDLSFPEFSGDGEYLIHYTINDLISTLGGPNDDASNTFTARLLLLLESRPLLGKSIHSQVISKVIAAYWRDYKGRETDFLPAFLANDILRLWRTFCVNYEARTKTETPVQKAKRKLKNYKLKHSRLLTCYSALIYLMAVVAKNGTVSQEDAKNMVALSPLERLNWLREQKEFVSSSKNVDKIVKAYVRFLNKTDKPEEEMVKMFSNSEQSRKSFQEAKDFGDEVFKLLNTMANTNPLYRILVV